MGFAEKGPGGEWGEPTDDTIWKFCDALDVSRFERFGLTDSTFYRLDVLRRNTDLFGIHAEEIEGLPPGSGCQLYLYGFKFAHRITVDGDKEPAEIWLHTCNLDQAEVWIPRFEGQDTVGCWLYLLQKIADEEEIGFYGTEDMFEVPH